MDQIRILLADDHNVLRDGLRLLLERQPDMVVVGEAADGRETVRLASEIRPDVGVMGAAMLGRTGVEPPRRIIQENPRTRVVMLSMHNDESYVLRSLRA